MIKVIRQGVFETNSSSTHSITIADSGKLQNNGFKNEPMNIFEIEFATTQPTLIHLTNN